MVSDELRNFKPYAIPVCVLKYSSLTDKNARDLKEELKTAMEDIGMVTVGMYCILYMYNFLYFISYFFISSLFSRSEVFKQIFISIIAFFYQIIQQTYL